jgi:hypothetical protein
MTVNFIEKYYNILETESALRKRAKLQKINADSTNKTQNINLEEATQERAMHHAKNLQPVLEDIYPIMSLLHEVGNTIVEQAIIHPHLVLVLCLTLFFNKIFFSQKCQILLIY